MFFVRYCRSSYPDYHLGGDGATAAGAEAMEEGDAEVDLSLLDDDGYQLVLPSGELSHPVVSYYVDYFRLFVDGYLMYLLFTFSLDV